MVYAPDGGKRRTASVRVPRAIDERWVGVPILRCARCGGAFAGQARFCPTCGVALTRSGQLLRAIERRLPRIIFLAGVAVGTGIGTVLPSLFRLVEQAVGAIW